MPEWVDRLVMPVFMGATILAFATVFGQLIASPADPAVCGSLSRPFTDASCPCRDGVLVPSGLRSVACRTDQHGTLTPDGRTLLCTCVTTP